MHSSPSNYCDSYYDRFADDFADTMTYSSTIEGINYVDDIFHRIDKTYGSEARDLYLKQMNLFIIPVTGRLLTTV